MIDQLSIFLENERGRLASLCHVMGDAGINMHSLTIADTTDFGIVRIICDAPSKAAEVLSEKGYRANVKKVLAVEVPNEPGGLAFLLDALDGVGVNIEYSYCFASPDKAATFVMKITGGSDIANALKKCGLKALQPEDLYVADEV